jgi:hypothetical protein
MKHCIATIARTLAVSFICLLSVGASAATFSTIDYPGAVYTEADAINTKGWIVGVYYGADQKRHGYLKTKGEFFPIDYPGRTRHGLSVSTIIT